MLGVGPRALNMLIKYRAHELHPQVSHGFVISFLVVELESEPLFVSGSSSQVPFLPVHLSPSCQTPSSSTWWH